jgi:tetratricopeptide (TPR) repeat protein
MAAVSPFRRKVSLWVLAVATAGALLFGLRAYVDWGHFQRGQHWRERGLAQAQSHQHDEAIVSLERSVGEYPYFVDCWCTLGELYYEHRDHQNAERCMDAALKYCPQTNPELAIIHRERGILFMRMDQFGKANQELSRAVALNPADPFTVKVQEACAKRSVGRRSQ